MINLYRLLCNIERWCTLRKILDEYMTKGKILIVDDDADIRDVLRLLLEKDGYEIVEASNGEDAISLIDSSFQCMILDVMMPKKDGIATCIDIRKQYHIPILFLTAKATEYDKYIGLSMGGDDYLVKPFSSMELLARVGALVRRYTEYHEPVMQSNQKIILKDVVVDKATSRVSKDGEEIILTNIEYSILLLLLEHPNKIFSIQNIYESVWNEEYDYLMNSTVMVHIKNLRKKLGDDVKHPKYIKNIWGRGYCLAN